MDTCPLGSLSLEERTWCSMKSKRCKVGSLLILSVCLIFLPGCWGKEEVESLAPLIAIGCDLGQKPNSYIITGQYIMPKKGATGAEVEDWTTSFEAPTLRKAYEMTNKIIDRVPFNGSTKVIVIGEDLAKAGFKDMLDFTQRFSEFRRSMYLVLAKGKAQSILEVKLRNGEIPGMFIKNNIETESNISTFPVVKLGHYLTVLGRKSTAPILPLINILKPGDRGIEYKAEGQDLELQIQGAGVFQGDRLVDLLTDEETKGYMWLDDSVKHRFIDTAGMGESKVSFSGHVVRSSTKYKVVDNNGTVELKYQVKTTMSVEEVLGQDEQVSETEWASLMTEAEKSLAKAIEKECDLSIQKEKDLGLDFLGIGRHLEQKKPAYWKTIKDQWEQEIADFPVSIEVEVKIDHSGMSSSSPTTK